MTGADDDEYEENSSEYRAGTQKLRLQPSFFAADQVLSGIVKRIDSIQGCQSRLAVQIDGIGSSAYAHIKLSEALCSSLPA